MRVGDVEREQAAEAGVADDLDRRMGLELLHERLRVRGDPLHPHWQRLEAPEQQPARVGRGDDSRAAAEVAQALRVLDRARHDRADQDVRVAAEVLGRAVDSEVGAALERAQVDGRRRGRVDHDAARRGRRGLKVRHGQKRVRGRLEPDQVDAVRRRAGLVELDEAEAPALQGPHEDDGSEVPALRHRDGRPGLERRDRARAGGEEQRRAVLELAQCPLGSDPGRVRVALVVEGARLAAFVGPDRRSVERLHGGQLYGGAVPT